MHEPSVLVIIPTYDEREHLRDVVEGIRASLPPAHVLVVDDASPDGTGDLAERLAREDGRRHVMRRPAKLGLGSAYVDGMRWGLEREFDALVQMDADLSHDPQHLPGLVSALAEADVAIGSRYVAGGCVEGWGPARRALSRGGSLYARLLLGVPIRDMTSGFNAYRHAALDEVDLDAIRSDGYSFQIELKYMLHRLGARVAEIPITFVDRRAGRSKMSGRIVAEAVVRVPLLRTALVTSRSLRED
jgi:dolichol-phosphate mannosyltransferase